MTLPDSPAPRSDRARRRRRPWLWLAAGLAVSAAVVTVAWFLDQVPTAPKTLPRAGGTVVDLVPSGLSAQERDGAGSGLGKSDSVRLAQGAWVQVAGPDGRVKQQYMAAEINPLPDKRVGMSQPRAVLFGTNGRVVTMRSDTMVAWIPKRELERGRLEGSVVIRVYSPRNDKPVDLAVDPAEMVIEAPEAEFDTKVGEISVDRNVRVTSQALSFEGQGLSLSLSQDGRSINRLVVDRPLSPIRIERSAELLRQRGEGLRPAGAPAPAAPQDPSKRGRGSRGGDGGESDSGDAQALHPYLLTLFDNVDVVSQEKGARISMTGQEMRVLFMLESGVGEGLAQASPESVAPQHLGAMTGVRLGAGAGVGLGFPDAAGEPPQEESIVIRYTGRLVMSHANADTPPLSSAKAVRIEMLGKPARVEDSKSSTVVTARHVRFESIVEEVHLSGAPDDPSSEPATLESPDFGISAPVLDLNRATGKGSVQGAGALRLGRVDSRAVRVAWGSSAEFTLAPGAADAQGSFRAARFGGGVRVRGQDFNMDSGTLAVEAEPVGKRDVLRRLVADDGVKATDLGARGGRLEAQRVELLMKADDRGEAQPHAMHATGAVMVTDPAQTLWASALHLAFVPARKASAGPASAKDDRAAFAAGKADLGSVIADGPVEMMLKDGTHIWATRLEGDATTRTAHLFGPDVLVVRGNSVIDQLTEVNVQEAPGKLSAAGAGRVSYYSERVLAADAGRMERPLLPQIPVMQATWREGLAYAEGAVPGKLGAPDRGLLLLQGAVKVRASRNPLEAESLDADEVQLETVPQVAASVGTPRAPKANATPVAAPQDMGQVARMVARGNVRIESREWREPQRQSEPRLFRLQSGNATYDVAAGLCFVEGSGSILVNNPPVPGQVPAKAGGDLSFSPEGITKFTWQRSLSMKRSETELTTVALDGNVEMQHLGEDDAGTGTLAADHLEATVRSAGSAGGPAGAAVGAASATPVFGAGATVEAILARGRVTVRTPEYDMETGEFELNERNRVAHLTATPGRAVTIIKRGAAPSGKAQSAVWDMRAGTITIEKLRGTLPR